MTWPYGRSKALLWVDLETTGSDKEADEIIEIGAIVTDFDYVEAGRYHAVCLPSDVGLARLRNNPVVLKMHTANGLLADLEAGRGVSLEAAEDDMVLWLRDYSDHQLMLAGSGVGHFDRGFITRDMPALSAKLSYPNLDIGVVRRFLALAGVLPAKSDKTGKKNHRAFDDIALHLAEARQYRALVRSVAQ